MRALGFDCSKSEVLEILKEYDPNRPGASSTNNGVKPAPNTIRFEDFMKVMTLKILQRDPLDEVRRAFKLFDVDKTGKVGFSDLKRVAQELGENLDDDELRAMIEEFDLDMDGESKYTYIYIFVSLYHLVWLFLKYDTQLTL